MCRDPLVGPHRREGRRVSTAALLLAMSALLGGGWRPRRRFAIESPTGSDETPSRPDPFAAASALDVFAVCLSAGMTVSAAAAATAGCAPPGLATLMRRASDLLALGADPDTAWQVPDDDGDQGCAALARLARRSAASGAALARGVEELAEQQRRNAVHAAAAAAERAGVLIAGPLGLCFLPSFVCLGIVPIVAGLAGEMFGAVLR